MARIRTVKPAFWSSPDTGKCSNPWARLLFIAMWNYADDEGRAEFTPKGLAAFAFPHDDWVDSRSVTGLLLEVSRSYQVALYTVSGRLYYYIPSWAEHQKVPKPSPSRHPKPDDGSPWDPPPSDQGISPDSGRTTVGLREDSGSLPALEVGNRKLEVGSRKQEEKTPRLARSSLAALGPNSQDSAAPARRGDAAATVIGNNDILAAWIDSMNENGVSPTPRSKGMVGKEIKSLVDSGNSTARVLEAARQAGAKGFPNIERELSSMNGKVIRPQWVREKNKSPMERHAEIDAWLNARESRDGA